MGEVERWERLVKVLVAVIAFSYLVFLNAAWSWSRDINTQSERIDRLNDWKKTQVRFNEGVLDILEGNDEQPREGIGVGAGN